MPSPVGHSLAGLAISRLWHPSRSPKPPDWPSAFAIVVAANLPDIDTLFYFLGDRSATFGWLAHRGPLHSLGAAVIIAALVFVVLRPNGVRFAGRWACLLGTVYASHIFLDYFNADTGRPYGVPMFWPISGAYHISPVTIFLNIEWRDTSTWISWHHLTAVIIEVAVLLPLVLIRRPRTGSPATTIQAPAHSMPDTPDISSS